MEYYEVELYNMMNSSLIECENKLKIINNKCDCKLESFYINLPQYKNKTSEAIHKIIVNAIPKRIYFFLKLNNIYVKTYGFEIYFFTNNKKLTNEDMFNILPFDIVKELYDSLEKISSPKIYKYIFLNEKNLNSVNEEIKPCFYFHRIKKKTLI
jgi:hypothetical protein